MMIVTWSSCNSSSNHLIYAFIIVCKPGAARGLVLLSFFVLVVLSP